MTSKSHASSPASCPGTTWTQYDAFITLDRGIEFQQNLASLPLSIVVIRARSNRFDDLEPLADAVLAALDDL